MSRNMCRAVLLWAFTSVLAAAEPPYQFSRTLDVRDLQREELLAVTLDSDVFAATRNGLPDVRILDDQGDEVSYVRRKATTTRSETERKFWVAREPSARPLDGGGLEIIVELDDEDPQPDGVRFITPLKDFEHRVRVFASSDGRDWQPLTENGLVFDYSQYMDVRSDTVPAAADGQRHFRIVIDDVTAEQESQLLHLTRRLQGGQETERSERITIQRRPFRISRLEFWQDIEKQRVTGAKKAEYPVADFRVEEDAEKRRTIVSVDTHREPLTALKLRTTTRNFGRRAQVEREVVRGVQREWRPIGSATISQLDFRNLEREELAVSIPESRESAYRFVIENRNSPPLAVDGIVGEGNVYELVFLATPRSEYRLAYGNPDAEPPSYDVAAITASLAEGYKPVQATLGQPIEMHGAAEGAWSLSTLLNDTRFLVAAIVVLVIGLGFGLYHAGRRLSDLPEE